MLLGDYGKAPCTNLVPDGCALSRARWVDSAQAALVHIRVRLRSDTPPARACAPPFEFAQGTGRSAPARWLRTVCCRGEAVHRPGVGSSMLFVMGGETFLVAREETRRGPVYPAVGHPIPAPESWVKGLATCACRRAGDAHAGTFIPVPVSIRRDGILANTANCGFNHTVYNPFRIDGR